MIGFPIHLEDRTDRIFHGLDVGFDSKVFAQRTWKDGSGIDHDRKD